jgi:hypothetical protein
MKPVVSVFIDGLKADSVVYMPFLNSFESQRRIKTELGYSNPSHASMYSGVYPNKHLNWFVWKYSPSTSPFKWLKGFRYFPQNIYTKFACYKLATLFTRSNTSFCGIPFLWWLPVESWSYFDVNEKKFWSEPYYLPNYPTIFDILRMNNIPYEVLGMVKGQTHRALPLIEQYMFPETKAWTYLFIGDVDEYSHKYGPDAAQTTEGLIKIDQVLEQKYRLFEKKLGDFYFMVFSDHGHIPVKKGVNLSSIFVVQSKNINDYIHIIDANYARFWFRNEEEEKQVKEILTGIQNGFILTEEHFRKYKVNMPDNRYGDLIFYLDAPYAFTHGLVSVLGKLRGHLSSSMHGYLPDHPEMDGAFITNKRLVDDSYLRLVDIMPSILHALDLPIPEHLDGKVVWSQN